MCESVAGRWDLGRTSHLSAPAVQFCAQGLLSAVLLCGCNTVAIASVYGGSQSSGSGFYVSCRACRAVGIVGGQDPRQEPPSGSPSTPSTPSTPVNPPSTSVNRKHPHPAGGSAIDIVDSFLPERVVWCERASVCGVLQDAGRRSGRLGGVGQGRRRVGRHRGRSWSRQ